MNRQIGPERDNERQNVTHYFYLFMGGTINPTLYFTDARPICTANLHKNIHYKPVAIKKPQPFPRMFSCTRIEKLVCHHYLFFWLTHLLQWSLHSMLFLEYFFLILARKSVFCNNVMRETVVLSATRTKERMQ